MIVVSAHLPLEGITHSRRVRIIKTGLGRDFFLHR